MVDELLSDEERAEALRDWWRDNWAWIIGGVVLGIAVLFGWRYWSVHTDTRAEQAGVLFQDLETAARSQDVAKVQETLDKLTADYASTPYTQQGRLLLAKLEVDAGKFTEA